ncbi:GTP cyclohydrolase 1 [termite gut metagenome]|uniref:GTP cyclohydrolase I n=1 Tax=termite gut metagenome TaxID=433724 RepID=A0A5J4SDC8_9ZZZZ
METEPTNTQDIEYSIKSFLSFIGEDSEREGLRETPQRVIRMCKEIFRGYDTEQKPRITTFQNGSDGIVYDGMITDSGTFYSICEHHIMPFFGHYWFAYIPNPNGKIIGLSKIARVVDYYSARLQIQERLVTDIMNEIEEALEPDKPLGIALLMKAEHLCKTMRGAKKQGEMISSVFRGVFKDNQTRQMEFLQLVK